MSSSAKLSASSKTWRWRTHWPTPRSDKWSQKGCLTSSQRWVPFQSMASSESGISSRSSIWATRWSRPKTNFFSRNKRSNRQLTRSLTSSCQRPFNESPTSCLKLRCLRLTRSRWNRLSRRRSSNGLRKTWSTRREDCFCLTWFRATSRWCLSCTTYVSCITLN